MFVKVGPKNLSNEARQMSGEEEGSGFAGSMAKNYLHLMSEKAITP